MNRVGFYIVPLLRLALGVIFIAASYHKLIDPASFAKVISQYQILPDAAINMVALFLPPLEALCGLLLLLWPRFRASAAFLILAMLIVFTAAIGYSMYRGIDISCGCFSSGGASMRVGWTKIAENAAMILAAIAVWIQALRVR